MLTLQAEIATVNAESVQRTREFEALRAEAAPLVDLNARLTAEADVLRRDLNQVNGLTLQAQAEQNRAQGELVQARSELDAANQQVALLTEQNSIQLDLFERSQETEAMALDINRLNARSAELAAENSFFQSRSRPISLGLEAELGRLRQEISAANAQVVALSGENQALLTEKALTAERAAQLGSQLSQAQAQAAEAEARRTAAQQTLDQAQAQVENRVGEVITLQAEIAAANENRGNQQGRILTLEAEIATANAEREKQVGQVLTLQAEIATVNAESVQRTREFEALRAEAAPWSFPRAGVRVSAGLGTWVECGGTDTAIRHHSGDGQGLFADLDVSEIGTQKNSTTG